MKRHFGIDGGLDVASAMGAVFILEEEVAALRVIAGALHQLRMFCLSSMGPVGRVSYSLKSRSKRANWFVELRVYGSIT